MSKHSLIGAALTVKVRKKIKTAVRRDQIARAALRVIAKSGVSGLTTSVLAKEAGVSEANLYRHFKDKDEIIACTVDKIGEGLRKNLEEGFSAGKSESPLIKLKKVFMLHLKYIERNEGIPRLVYSEEIHIGNRELKRKLLDSINSYSSRLELLIKEAKKAGLVSSDINTEASALTLVGMVQVSVLRWSLSGFSFQLADEGMRLWKNFEKVMKRGQNDS